MEVNNGGGKLFGVFNGSGGGNNPTTVVDAGDAFLMNRGYSLAWNGGGPLDGCEASGQWIGFRTTRNERLTAGDPRLSLEERYGTHQGYVNAVANAARALEARRFLLPADVQRYIDEAAASNVLR
jgi:hypothetical protein